jgi:hypothetical protein
MQADPVLCSRFSACLGDAKAMKVTQLPESRGMEEQQGV